MKNWTVDMLVLTSLVYFATGLVLSVPTEPNQHSTNVAGANSLFDCRQYRQIFGKQYDSHDEEMSRCVYLLAKALDVFTSGVAYKFRKQNHYLAVNKFSDRSPQELDMMKNKALEGELVGNTQEQVVEKGYNVQQVDHENIAKKLQAEIETVLKENHLKESLASERRRKKRDTTISNDEEQNHLPPRHISIDMLIMNDKHASEPDGLQKQVMMQPPSNNKHYDALLAEPMTLGLADQQEQVHISIYKPVDIIVSSVRERIDSLGNLVQLLNPFKNNQDKSKNTVGEAGSDSRPKLPDEMFVDLRKTGCFFKTRDQGYCGSCYAFAAISIMEYMYCKKEGHLTPFSEQYMINCGKRLIKQIHGCGGANALGVTSFIHSYGLELRHNFRYKGVEGECPYDEDTKSKITGYIRYEKPEALFVQINHWPELLDNGTPLYVSYSAGDDFYSYAGGVYDGHDCEQTNHAMVLIGHGREDGQEFWFLRNSHGRDWGKAGYFKLAKSASARCIGGQFGLAFGTDDGKHFAEPKKNELNEDALGKKSSLDKKKFFDWRTLVTDETIKAP